MQENQLDHWRASTLTVGLGTMSQDQTSLQESAETIPARNGFGLAAVILGGVAIPLVAFVGVCSFFVSLPVFLLWYLLPILIMAILLGMLTANSHLGVAGATLSMIAFLLAMTFVLVDRTYGTEIRSQISAQNNKTPALNLEQLFQAGTKAIPTTQKSN